MLGAADISVINAFGAADSAGTDGATYIFEGVDVGALLVATIPAPPTPVINEG